MLRKRIRQLLSGEKITGTTLSPINRIEIILKELAPQSKIYNYYAEPHHSIQFQKVLTLSDSEKQEVLKAAFQTLPPATQYQKQWAHQQIIYTLLKSGMSIDFSTLIDITSYLNQSRQTGEDFLIRKDLLERLAVYVDQQLKDDRLEVALDQLNVSKNYYVINAKQRQFNEQIESLRNKYNNKFALLDHDTLGEAVATFIQLQEEEDWLLLITRLSQANKGSKPSKKWWTDIQKLMKPIPQQHLTDTLHHFLQIAIDVYKSHLKNNTIRKKSESNEHFIRSLIWLSGYLNVSQLNQDLVELGLICYKKIPGYGQCSKRLGNACLFAFTALPYKTGIAYLTQFRAKVKYPSVRKIIENRIYDVAEREGKTKDEIEEMGVPTYGLNETQQLEQMLGDFKAIVTIESIQRVSLKWQKPDGKLQKSVPASIKSTHADAIKALKKAVKEIKEALPAQTHRIERIFMNPREWKYSDWIDLYIHHPFMGYIGKNLIWHFQNDANKTTAFFQEGQWIDNQGHSIDWINDNTKVQLWHPIGFSADYIEHWRDFLIDHQIQQPIKQAFREIYILTDAEINTNTYSNRFAAHIIRQHQFYALCKLRDWHYTYQGNWDSHNIPYKELPNWGLSVRFLVDADWESQYLSAGGIFEYVHTDQVQFYDNHGRMELQEVPALVFSEIMREVDLFVGVCSIGNDPSWTDRGNERLFTYWRSYSTQNLTENAKTRKAILEKLIPRLKIADQCSFTEKQLVVKGKIRTYYIHLGSGNIHMSPNNQYLCIVPGGRNTATKAVFLPFEGDNLLSIILSKAFLLAEDEKIKDPTIVSQLKR